MKILAFSWAGLAVLSLLVYAFTGHTAWSSLNPQTDGMLRFILLFLVHVAWAPILALVLEREA